MINYTAKYTRIASGTMGQIMEWPEVVTEGSDLDECGSMLRDALREMVTAYRQMGWEIPASTDVAHRRTPSLLHPPKR